MPTISFNKQRLLEKIGKKLSDEELESLLPLMKPEVEDMNEEEIKLELTPDRADLFFLDGLARAFSGFLGERIGLKKVVFDDPKIEVKVEKVESRPYFACFIVRDVDLDSEKIKELMNLQEVLHATIGRKRKRVAIGIHDFDKIKPPIVYKEAFPRENFIPLGYDIEMTLENVLQLTDKGRKFAHLLSSYSKYPAICDENGMFSFPPILNSNRTKVTQSTKNLFVDITGESRRAVDEATKILAYYSSFVGRLEAVKMIHGDKEFVYPNFEEERIEITKSDIAKLLGVELSDEEIQELLERMGYDVMIVNDVITVVIPIYRIDILHKVDVIEDIAIAYGLNNFKRELPQLFTIGSIDEKEQFIDKLKSLMIGLGFTEVITPVLTNKKKHFENVNLKEEKVVELENPVSEEYTIMRKYLYPSLINLLAKNTHYNYPQKVFEVGYVVEIDENAETKTRSIKHLAAAIASGKTNLSEIKSVLDEVMMFLGIEEYDVEECKIDSFIPSRGGYVKVNNQIVGSYGEIHPEVLEKNGFWVPITILELDLSKL
ncbi:MAG: phenylalanine--tRNA ligase subunit beta [Candidatus Aenigmarchaeota archaeon]|nr:phenylalanine--tRNA ligase subunit beta [Candidatus Aenigmarchaeota archaeon]